MTRFRLAIILVSTSPAFLAGALAVDEQAGQIARFLDSIKAGAPGHVALEQFDPQQVDLAKESPVILRALSGPDPTVRWAAISIVNWALAFHQSDPAFKKAAAAMVGAVSEHYDDPDPGQPPNAPPTDAWKGRVMHFIAASGATPPPALVQKMVKDLDQTGDAYLATAGLAAASLTQLHPMPDQVLDTILARMKISDFWKMKMIGAVGESHADDPRLVKAVLETLKSSAAGDPGPHTADMENTSLRPANVLLRAAAHALGLMGPGARDAIPVLRAIAESESPAYDYSTRQVARAALDALIGVR